MVVVGRFSRHNEATRAVDLGMPIGMPLDLRGRNLTVRLIVVKYFKKKKRHVHIACVMIKKLKGPVDLLDTSAYKSKTDGTKA